MNFNHLNYLAKQEFLSSKDSKFYQSFLKLVQETQIYSNFHKIAHPGMKGYCKKQLIKNADMLKDFFKVHNYLKKEIIIEDRTYSCINFEHHILVDCCEHLKVEVAGKIHTKESKVLVIYEGFEFYGYKIFPTYKDGTTRFMLYIFQEGDSEI